MLGVHLVFGYLTRRVGFDPDRRRLLEVARVAALASPAVVYGYGFWVERRQFHLKEVDVRVAGLAKDLDGVRLVQVTDIHFGPYLDKKTLSTLSRWRTRLVPNLRW
jgi:predicted MPP superfamily phosphohydrolase